MALSTTWTQQDVVGFNSGTLATLADCRTQVQNNLHRGTLSSTSSPTDTQVNDWIARGKQELAERYGFSWRRVYSYADTSSGVWRFALPKDFAGGGAETRLRNLTDDEIVEYVDPITFDNLYPDPAGNDNSTLDYYTIKDRELWLSAPADGAYRLELEYVRTGEDATPSDVSYLPEIMRFRVCDFATYMAFKFLMQWEAASMYKVDWIGGVEQSKSSDGKKKWAAMNYMARNWHNMK